MYSPLNQDTADALKGADLQTALYRLLSSVPATSPFTRVWLVNEL